MMFLPQGAHQKWEHTYFCQGCKDIFTVVHDRYEGFYSIGTLGKEHLKDMHDHIDGSIGIGELISLRPLGPIIMPWEEQKP